MSNNFEIVEFVRPEGNNKNLFISGIPGLEEEQLLDVLYRIFSAYGPVFSIQTYHIPLKFVRTVAEPDTCVINTNIIEKSDHRINNENLDPQKCTMGYYAFVTFFMAISARRAKDELKGKIVIKSTECKVGYAKRKKDVGDAASSHLHFIKCEELANCCLGYNGWSTSIKLLGNEEEEQENKVFKATCVCVVELFIKAGNLKTEGLGAWNELYSLADPSSKAKAICKCKKLSYQRAVEEAFSRVILVVFSNGRVCAEIDTTKPELRLSDDAKMDEPVIQVNNLDLDPEEAASDSDTLCQSTDIDDINLQILQELEENL